MKRAAIFVAAVWLAAMSVSCTRHRVELAPVEVKPIHITIDVNVKVDRALDDFFGDIDQKAQTIDPKLEEQGP
ncbi:MAG: YnbE family lipoprotein [Desulfobacterales bacterium]